MKSMRRVLMMLFVLLGSIATAQAGLELRSISYDPPIIVSGDEVDIVIQYQDTAVPDNDGRVGDSTYTFHVRLEPDDSLTEGYVTIQDSVGDTTHGSELQGAMYNRVFRIKIDDDAPAGNYEFRLVGQWYKDGAPEGGEQFVRFRMPVKREGIILGISTIETVPAQVRPGDNYVKITGYLDNSGEKRAKSIEVTMETPEGIDASYSNNNRVWAGSLAAGEQKVVNFYVDVDEDADPGVRQLDYRLHYMDVDDNRYSKTITLPLLIKERSYIEVLENTAEGLAGGDVQLRVRVKNTGQQSAEAVDVRIIKQNSQPFTVDVRSDYIGELEPGEEGVAVFDIGVRRDAELKEHDLKLLIRAKGDSEEGDDTIYTYNRRATIHVTDEAPNYLLGFGLAGAALAGAVFAGSALMKRRKRK